MGFSGKNTSGERRYILKLIFSFFTYVIIAYFFVGFNPYFYFFHMFFCRGVFPFVSYRKEDAYYGYG